MTRILNTITNPFIHVPAFIMNFGLSYLLWTDKSYNSDLDVTGSKVVKFSNIIHHDRIPSYNDVIHHDLKTIYNDPKNRIIFVSHPWLDKLSCDSNNKIWESLKLGMHDRENYYVWLDYFCINQLSRSEKRDQVGKINNIIILCDEMLSVRDAKYFNRAWCIYEVVAANHYHNNPPMDNEAIRRRPGKVYMPDHFSYYRNKIMESKVTVPSDKSVILDNITKMENEFLNSSTWFSLQLVLSSSPVWPLVSSYLLFQCLTKRNEISNVRKKEFEFSVVELSRKQRSIRNKILI